MKTLLPTVLAAALFGVTALALSAVATAQAPAAAADGTYVVHLHPMNSNVTGLETAGEARFTVAHGEIAMHINVNHLAPGIMHMQHLHGFPDGKQATCPAAGADVNGDGIIDLHETEAASGTTMLPLQGDPASMQVATDTYPKASASGAFTYDQKVPLAAMSAAFGKTFKGASLDLDHRVLYVHGVLPSAKLASSVASLPGVPAQVTLPIACGQVERVAH